MGSKALNKITVNDVFSLFNMDLSSPEVAAGTVDLAISWQRSFWHFNR
jgi:hypothetical protein